MSFIFINLFFLFFSHNSQTYLTNAALCCEWATVSYTHSPPWTWMGFVLVFLHTVSQHTSPNTHTHTQPQIHIHTLSCSPLWVLLGPYSLQLNFKHSSHYISHRCHHARGVYIPVCIRGVELRARCDRQRLTVEKDVFMFTDAHAHTWPSTVEQGSNFTTGNIWKNRASIHHL